MIKEVIKKKNIEIVVSQSSKGGMPYCGDDYYFTMTDDYFLCVLADGLGSGKYAYESSNAVIEEVKKYQDEDVETLMKYSNSTLVNKRGAAVSILKVDYNRKEFVYSSVGNIRFFLYNRDTEKLVYPLPVTGYLSGRVQKYHTQKFRYEPNSKFILHSDGLRLQGAKTVLKSYASLERNAEEILRNNTIHSDDTTFILGSLLS